GSAARAGVDPRGAAGGGEGRPRGAAADRAGALEADSGGRADAAPGIRFGDSVSVRFTENPFYILGLRPGASRAAIEQEAQKLLGMLEVGLDAAARYETPFGPATRTPDLVRRALAELRDPERRVVHELWAVVEPGAARGASERDLGWPDAYKALGWRR